MRRMLRPARLLLAIFMLCAFLIGGWQFVELQQKHHTLSQDYEELDKQYGYLAKDLGYSIERRDDLLKELNGLQIDRDSLLRENAGLTQQIDFLAHEKEIAERIHKESEIKYARIEKELTDRIGVLTEERTRKEEETRKLQADYNFLAAQNDALRNDGSRLQNDANRLLQDNKNLEALMHSTVSIAEERERAIGALKREIILLSQMREALQEVLKGRLPLAFSGDSATRFRDEVLGGFGFTPTAQAFIRAHSKVLLIDDKKIDGEAGCWGGAWAPWDYVVILPCKNYEAAVHEFSHVWWHAMRLYDPQLKKNFVRDVVRLAKMSDPKYKDAVELAKEYVYGRKDWKGMFCNNDNCANPQNIQDEDFGDDGDFTGRSSKINDWEMYAGMSSWHMGQHKDGARELPPFMWQYFEPQFTGRISASLYYQRNK